MFISTFLCIEFLIYLYIYMHASPHSTVCAVSYTRAAIPSTLYTTLPTRTRIGLGPPPRLRQAVCFLLPPNSHFLCIFTANTLDFYTKQKTEAKANTRLARSEKGAEHSNAGLLFCG
uniref:Putative secreted protein n=1 Tax=Anopheles darlingi TaxID=43151 RepID=A0A2M4DNM5_ANODA